MEKLFNCRLILPGVGEFVGALFRQSQNLVFDGFSLLIDLSKFGVKETNSNLYQSESLDGVGVPKIKIVPK